MWLGLCFERWVGSGPKPKVPFGDDYPPKVVYFKGFGDVFKRLVDDF